MKKLLIGFIVATVVFIMLMYWSLSSTDKNNKRSELINIENVNSINFKDYDSVMVAATTLYDADEVKILMQGEHYRDVWAAPIKVPVLFLDTLFGGATIIKEGGGKQTHSLKLKANNGIMYTLRSINKDPQALVPEFAKTLGLENIIVDGISAQHPYGALLAAKLSETLEVLHTHPKVVFLPKQKLLKDFNTKFGNRMFLLEYETESDVNWTDYRDIITIVETEGLQELKLEFGENLSIDKQGLIRLRLFDFLIGDWDRHSKQWGWAVQKKANEYLAIPIAGDRDNAFFDTDGIIPSILSNENVVPKLRPFEDDIDYIEGLVYPFDRYFLLNSPESLFVNEALHIQKVLTDDVIDQALLVWPKNIIELNGEEIATKIKSRRDKLLKYARALKQEVDNQGELDQPLKGSEDLNLPSHVMQCFECEMKN
ncbi:HipA domain-containing protein [Psychroserpens damuponensis]|uniref:hypothetical protein n=1 Tax=Psychroserpens damuponensis TaxID=943936 RepID=UPI000A43804F|nr:hypothetical protein [Psychroserpens damuponensis]